MCPGTLKSLRVTHLTVALKGHKEQPTLYKLDCMNIAESIRRGRQVQLAIYYGLLVIKGHLSQLATALNRKKLK